MKCYCFLKQDIYLTIKIFKNKMSPLLFSLHYYAWIFSCFKWILENCLFYICFSFTCSPVWYHILSHQLFLCKSLWHKVPNRLLYNAQFGIMSLINGKTKVQRSKENIKYTWQLFTVITVTYLFLTTAILQLRPSQSKLPQQM